MGGDDVSRELLAAVLEKDEAAAQELVRRLYPLVVKLVRAHRPARTAEEDLCQMIFIKILQKLGQYSGTAPFEHWVSRIAVNTCINQIQAEKARPELREADLSEEQSAVVRSLATTSEELAPEHGFASRDLVEHLMKVLKPAERLVIDLLYLQERSVNEIRQITGWSAALVKVRAFRARQKMKQQFLRLRTVERA
ncbi:MAG TPA: sigma-70 family RNA polymerase sigma factor [Chthoniobacterales bacterium]|jgi:RNA polymerase sigma-70 factor (ECF subfamily)|nr:sigma-70 family RNA polymerase sigma factor [Chthoniobacterales bacterium]